MNKPPRIKVRSIPPLQIIQDTYQDRLDTLTAGQTTHARVRDKFGIQTEECAVGFNLPADKRAELATCQSFLLVNFGNHLLMGSHDVVSRDPRVVSTHHRSPLLVLLANIFTKDEGALVFVRVLVLPSRVNADDTSLRTINLVDLVHRILILLCDNLVGSIHGLAIFTRLEAPLDVLRGSLVQVVINMRKGVLFDVRNPDVLMLINLAARWNQLSAEKG